MAATLPTFADLAGDVEPRLIEASRIYRATPWCPPNTAEAHARNCLVGATDAAAREHTLRWLEQRVSAALTMATALEGDRADASSTAEWDMEGGMLVGAELAPVFAYIDASGLARDDDWPTAGKVAMDVCDPTIRGDATRVLRDMWWRAMLTEQIKPREKPGQWLASVGIVAGHVEDMLGLAASQEMIEEATAPREEPGLTRVVNETGGPMTVAVHGHGDVTLPVGATLMIEGGPGGGGGVAPREHPPIPRNGSAETRLPGQRRHSMPEAGELREAFQLLTGAEISNNPELLANLGISKSTWNNWLSARTSPRIDVNQARLLAAECARQIADIERAEAIFKQVTK